MFDNMLWYLCIVFLCFGVGEFLGVLTKARVSAVFVTLVIFLIAFMTKVFPVDIINRAELTGIGKWSAAFLIFHMGTMINFKELAREWRTVVTAAGSMIVVAIAGLALIPVIGFSETVVSVPIINGGIVATQIMTGAAMDKGLAIAAALGTICYATQKFVGTPIASYFGLKEARKVLEEYRKTGINPFHQEVRDEKDSNITSQTFAKRYDRYFGPFTCLAVTGFAGWLAFVLGKYTGINYSIWCLILGAFASYIGWVPERILDKAKASGLLNAAMFAIIIPSLGRIQWSDLISLTYSLIMLFAISVIVLFVFFYILPCWKLIGSRNLAMGISVMQMLGFPATYLIANEIAQATGETEDEKQLVLDAIMPKYLVGGFATVTSLSIIMAGILVKFL